MKKILFILFNLNNHSHIGILLKLRHKLKEKVEGSKRRLQESGNMGGNKIEGVLKKHTQAKN